MQLQCAALSSPEQHRPYHTAPPAANQLTELAHPQPQLRPDAQDEGATEAVGVQRRAEDWCVRGLAVANRALSVIRPHFESGVLIGLDRE